MTLDRKSRSRDSTRVPDSARKSDESGIALFMVIAAISILAVLATEMTYVAQVNQSIAYDGLDQIKAHYLAKSGLKLSLLRLKAYQQVKTVLGNITGGAGGKGGVPGVPKGILEKIWSFPFFFPVPTNIPGLTTMDKEKIEKFQKNSGLQGKFSALIESESAKYNLNSILAPFAAPSPTPSPSATPPTTPVATPTPTPTPTFDPSEARRSLQEFLAQILQNKMEADADFQSIHRDFRMEDFMDNLVAWADPTYEARGVLGFEDIAVKRGPFYTLSELHMIPPMEDDLYNLFAPALTVSTTPGININTMQERTLRALVPGITDDEVKEFFKFRDAEDEDNSFKNEDDFFKYLLNSISVFRQSQASIDEYKKSLTKRNIRLVMEESEFKITISAQVNSASRLLEAWVSLGKATAAPKKDTTRPAGSPPPLAGPGMQPAPDPGLRIIFMRIL